MKKQYIRRALLLILCVILAFCGTEIYLSREEKTLEIIYIPKVIDDTNEFWTALLAGARMSAQEANVNLTIVAPEKEEDYEKQNQLILWAIEQRPDAIMISPCDYNKNLEAARQVKEHGIHLVFVDSTVEEPLGEALVATDNYTAGQKIGELAGTCMDENTQIAIVSHVKNASTAIERIHGFEDEIGTAKAQIVDTVYCDSQYAKAYNLTCDLLGRNPQVNLIVGTNEYSAVGAANAVKELGYQDRIAVIGFDNSLEQVQLLEEGVLSGIVIQKPFNMGYLGVQQAAAIARGEPYEKLIDSGSVMITRENMNEQENQKLLFPFVGKQFRENVLE